MIPVIINKANFTQLQLSHLLLNLCTRFVSGMRLPLPDFRNIGILLYRVRFRSSQRIPYRCTGNGSNNISNGRATISASPAMIIISDKPSYRAAQTSSDRSACHDSSRISHTPRRTSTQKQSGKQNYC